MITSMRYGHEETTRTQNAALFGRATEAVRAGNHVKTISIENHIKVRIREAAHVGDVTHAKVGCERGTRHTISGPINGGGHQVNAIGFVTLPGHPECDVTGAAA